MNTAQIHLMLNHLPVLGIPFGLLTLAYGVRKNQQEFLKFALMLFAALAVLTLPVFFSGDGAEDVIENAPGISGALIETHEEAATAALVGCEVLGILAFAGLLRFRQRPEYPRPFVMTIAIIGIVTAAILAYTAHAGGQIRHPELSSSFTAEKNH